VLCANGVQMVKKKRLQNLCKRLIIKLWPRRGINPIRSFIL